jgi:hypothetical protein
MVTIECCWQPIRAVPSSFLLVYIPQISPVLIVPVLLILSLKQEYFIHHGSSRTSHKRFGGAEGQG